MMTAYNHNPYESEPIDFWMLEDDLPLETEDNGPSDTTERELGRADQFYTRISPPCDTCLSFDDDGCLGCPHLVEVTDTDIENDPDWVFDGDEWHYCPDEDDCIPLEIQQQLEARLQELLTMDVEHLDSQALDGVGAEIHHIQQQLGITNERPEDEDEIPF